MYAKTRVVKCPVCGRLIKTRAIRGFRCCGCEWEIQSNLIQKPTIHSETQEPSLLDIGGGVNTNDSGVTHRYHRTTRNTRQGLLGGGDIKITFDEIADTICIELGNNDEAEDGEI